MENIELNEYDNTLTLQNKVFSRKKYSYKLWDPIKDIFFPLSKKQFSIGKSSKCKVVLPYPTVSRFHGSATLDGDILYVEDSNSRNGIFLNNKKINKTIVKIGDVLMIGDIPLVLCRGDKHGIYNNSIVTRNQQFIDLIRKVERVSKDNLSIMIAGESGTGKELIANIVHACSTHLKGMFVPLNCGAISTELMESEMFGHVRGAFSGAQFTRDGVISKANSGTLFLDEIGELRGEHQSTLLRFLETKKYRPVGSDREIYSNCRILTATHKNLKDEVEKGNFRLDLYYRLSEIIITIPPLRERKEDILPLLEHFKTPKPQLDILAKLLNYSWPGNVRELKSISKVASILGWKEALYSMEFKENKKNINNENIVLFDSLQEKIFKEVLNETSGNLSAAARLLGLPRTTLINKMKKIGLK
jgi:transcriptional regulator with PAS, ATPase and Fis domain